MKKLLGIIVLGLLLSGNAYAEKYKATAMHYYGSTWHKASHPTSQSEAEKLAVKKCVANDRHIRDFPKGCFLFLRGATENVWKKSIEKYELQIVAKEIKQEIKPFKTICKNIGYSEGTEKFADCVKDIYLKKLDAENQKISQTTTTVTSKPKRKIDPSFWDDLLGISGGLLGGKSSSSTSSSSVSCSKIKERTSGNNKICSYNCMGSEVTKNIRATQICPLSIKR